MSRAEALRDRIIDGVAEIGFAGHGLHVRVGSDTARHRWTPEVREDVQSAAKGVAVIAMGIAEREGILSADEPVAPAFPGAALGDGTDGVTLRHLLTMTSGVDFPWSPTTFQDHDDVAFEFLSRPTPGRRFQYASASTYVAMRALAARVGDVVAWLQPRLFDPLGIADARWERCPRGFVLAGEGLLLTTDELARVGALIADRGTVDGERIVDAAWIDGMHGDWDPAYGEPAYDGYAMGGWKGPGDAWRLHGSGGQLVIFAGDAVVTLTADDHFRADRTARMIVDAAGAEQVI
ncbi:serine hydrolase domain-containing protein [Microbacterium indicum]|uniref:serine hydrolase domain-containing protein n=1 Tax=Microbacterium indicum TaxID=358100 RepID=UPI000412DCCF|nr:serine hydrolase [Microbacterium indicum]